MKTKLVFLVLFITSICQEGISQQITLLPGFLKTYYYEDSEPISYRELETLIKSDKMAYKYWRKHKDQSTLATVIMSSGFILYFYGVERERNYKNGLNQKIAAVGCVGAAVGISISSYKMFRKTFTTYNENITSIGFGPTNNGIGLVWSF